MQEHDQPLRHYHDAPGPRPEVPAGETVEGEQDQWCILVALSSRLLMFLMTSRHRGALRPDRYASLNYFARADRDIVGIHIRFLAAVSIMPFSPTLLAEFVG